MTTDTNIDPFSTPAGELKEPAYPVLSDGQKRMLIKSFEKLEKDGKARLSIRLATTKDDVDTEGRKVFPGFSFTATIFLTPGENETLAQIAEKAAMPVKCALGSKTKESVTSCLNNPSLIVDKPVDVKVGNRKGKGDFEDRVNNVVKAWILPS